MISWDDVKKVLIPKNYHKSSWHWASAIDLAWHGELRDAIKAIGYPASTASHFCVESEKYPIGGTLTVTMKSITSLSEDPRMIPGDIVAALNAHNWDIVDLPVKIIKTKKGNYRLKFYIFPTNMDLDYYLNNFTKLYDCYSYLRN